MNTHPSPRGVFRGWYVVSGVLGILVISAGIGFYGVAIFLGAMVTELGVTVGQVSLASVAFFVVAGVTGFLLANQIDRRDVRWFFGSGAIVGAAALAFGSQVDSIAELYVFFALLGLAFALTALVPANTVVNRWFRRLRPMALTIATTGLSIGGIAVTPIIAWLIRAQGLSSASFILAGAWLVLIPVLTFTLVRSSPADLGLHPDGADEDPSAALSAGAIAASATRRRYFALIAVAFILVFLAEVGGVAHAYQLAFERIDATTAAFAVSTLAFASMVMRFVGGWIAQRIPLERHAVIFTLLQAAGLTAIAYADSKWAVLAGLALLGSAIGNVLMSQSLLLAEAYGTKAFARIYATAQLYTTIGVAAGPAVFGWLHDVADYRTSYLTGAIVTLVAAGVLVAAGSPRPERDAWA